MVERIGHVEFCHADVMHHVPNLAPTKVFMTLNQQELAQKKIDSFLTELQSFDIIII